LVFVMCGAPGNSLARSSCDASCADRCELTTDPLKMPARAKATEGVGVELV
jgi:hypothetical protein